MAQVSIVKELSEYCWIKTCWSKADKPRSIYCAFHSKTHVLGVWLWWFAAVLALVTMALSENGCSPRPHFSDWETWRVSGGVEDLECQVVGTDPPYLQCRLPGQRLPQ